VWYTYRTVFRNTCLGHGISLYVVYIVSSDSTALHTKFTILRSPVILQHYTRISLYFSLQTMQYNISIFLKHLPNFIPTPFVWF
jgi:hypothetical protein